MPEIKTQLLRASFESWFKKAMSFREFMTSPLARECLEGFASYGLKPTSLVLKGVDQLFNYTFSFVLFNGNAKFTLTAETLKVEFDNASGAKDLEIIVDCLLRVYGLSLPEISNTIILAQVHGGMQSPEQVSQFLSTYAAAEKGILSGGKIIYTLPKQWGSELRLLVEKSLTFPNAVFIHWTTNFEGPRIDREVLDRLKSALDDSVSLVGLAWIKNEV